MSSLNRVFIIGRVGQDPQVDTTPQNKTVAKFSVASSYKQEGYGKEGKETVEWHNIVAWEKLGELCKSYLSKGKLVYVEGRLATRTYDKDGAKHYRTEIIAQNVQFLSPKDEAPIEARQAIHTPIPQVGDFDDLPF